LNSPDGTFDILNFARIWHDSSAANGTEGPQIDLLKMASLGLSMFPGIGGKGVSPKKMKQMMKQMGINIEEIEGVEEVVIRTGDREIFFLDASVTVMDAQGNRSYQVVGTAEERPREVSIPDSDVDLVVAQTGCSQEEAKAALKEADGDLAEAIVKLSSS
jgi:nascent polypeptide-associated complex subunit alpha